MRIFLGLVACVLLAGCCSNSQPKPPDRFEMISNQEINCPRHSNFSIMVIKDKNTEKEFKVIYNSSWGYVAHD